MLSRQLRHFPTFRLAVMISLAFFVATIRGAEADEARFSSTLSDTQRTETGLAQLTEDNIAVIDALVRQDQTTLKRRGSLSSFGSFTQRRSDNEREIAGFNRLTAEQLARLDGLAALRISPPATAVLNAENGRRSSSGALVRPAVKPYALEVHGSVSLSYGWSKGGSLRSGEMVVSVQDPAHRFALTVGYSESSGKGLSPVYDPYDETYRYRPGVDSPVLRP
jgi:hypothetical protein